MDEIFETRFQIRKKILFHTGPFHTTAFWQNFMQLARARASYLIEENSSKCGVEGDFFPAQPWRHTLSGLSRWILKKSPSTRDPSTPPHFDEIFCFEPARASYLIEENSSKCVVEGDFFPAQPWRHTLSGLSRWILKNVSEAIWHVNGAATSKYICSS